MTQTRTPIESDRLSPAVAKVLSGPGPLKMMAARGLAPLPRPGDLLTVLYQLGLDADAKLGEAAQKSARELPDKLLAPGLQDAELDPRVLDFFAAQVRDKEVLVEIIVLNRATGDDTIVALAGVVNERLVEIIAANEQRLLRCPEVIGAMYMNRSARMSTVDRAVELAVRHELRVAGIPAWDEVVAAVLGTKAPEAQAVTDVDAVFAAAAKKATVDESSEAAAAEEAAEIPISKMSIPMKIRLATLGNKFARGQLIRDANKLVSNAAIKAPGVNELEAVKYAGNNALSEDVISYIASRRDWIKLYSCKVALVGNTKTPLPTAMRLIAHLRDKDLRSIMRSKSVPSAVATHARQLVQTRARGGKN